jgi:hypothetical protein
MANLVYPDELPTPSVAPFRPSERRFTSGTPFNARTFQRDRLALQEITFPPLSVSQASVLRDWFKTDLEYGGNWFNAPKWPRPQGRGGVRKWMDALRFENIGPFYVRVTGYCEVRGVGELPTIHIPTIWLLNRYVTTGGVNDERPWVLSNGDQTVFVPDELGSESGVENHYQGSIYTNNPKSSGKRYIEQIILRGGNYPDGGSPTMFSFGIVNELIYGTLDPGGINAFTNSGTWGFNRGGTPGEGEYRGDDGAGGQTTIPGLPEPVTGGVVMLAIDIDAKKMWMGYDGTWFTGDPATDTDPIAENMPGTSFNPGFAAQRAILGSTLRSVDADFSFPVPSGFIAWSD